MREGRVRRQRVVARRMGTALKEIEVKFKEVVGQGICQLEVVGMGVLLGAEAEVCRAENRWMVCQRVVDIVERNEFTKGMEAKTRCYFGIMSTV